MSKNAVGEPFSLSLISGIEKVRKRELGGRGECQDFPSKLSCLTVPKIFEGNPAMLSFRENPVAKYFMDKSLGGTIKISFRKVFVAQCQKIP